MSSFDYQLPTRIRFGWGRLAEIGQAVGQLGGRKVFLVTGRRSARASGLLDRLRDFLKDFDLEVFDRVEENPTIETVDQGADQCRRSGCDLVVGLGGGSALDAAKAVAMLQRNPGSIREYLDQERTCQTKGLPLVALPTTSGTGSEVTPFAVITHPAKRAKPAVAPVQMFPDLALVDPELTVSMPLEVTASSGLDALCQAVEGFWSTRANPLTRSLSSQGIILAMRHLEAACRDKDRPSVTGMALASHLTGIQMSSLGNTAIHPLSYPFTMDYHVPHGFACAVFLPAFLRFNAGAIEEDLADVLRALGLDSAAALAGAIDELMDRLKAPKRLGQFGVKAEDLPGLVRRGLGKSTAWNPRPLKEEDILGICRSLL